MKMVSVIKSLWLATMFGVCVNAGLPGSIVLAAPDSADGCPAWGNPGGNPGVKFMGLMTLDEAVRQWSAQITDAWYAEQGLVEEDFLAQRLAIATAIDKNGDGLLCMAQNWGADLNPNSHWAEIFADTLDPPFTEAWFLTDNHVGRSNER